LGKKVHGIAKSIIVDTPHKLQLRGFNAKANVVCSECQSHNEVRDYHYIVRKSCYV
jgi:hypothetical protein